MKTLNPLRTLREAANLSVSELARHANVSSQLITRSEQGVYSSPSSRLLSTLWNEAPEGPLHDPVTFDEVYCAFQTDRRKAHYGRLLEPYTFFPVMAVHPFVRWREDSSIPARIAVSKMYCVHPALITKFENQSYLCASIPRELVRALRESGYSQGTLDAFATAYRDWKAARRESYTDGAKE